MKDTICFAFAVTFIGLHYEKQGHKLSILMLFYILQLAFYILQLVELAKMSGQGCFALCKLIINEISFIECSKCCILNL